MRGVPCVLGYNISFAQDLEDMPSFTCNARYFLITYAQCGDLSEWSVLERFTTLGAECIIAREHHETEGVHLHVFVDFGRKFRSRRADVFDVDGRHPNIQHSRGTPEKGYDYAIKDGEVLAGGLGRPSGNGNRSIADKWSQIASSENREEFWQLCEELDPKSLCCSFGQLQKFADWKFAEDPPMYETPGGLEFVGGDVDGRDLWIQESGIRLEEPLLGESEKYGLPPWALNGPRHPLPGSGIRPQPSRSLTLGSRLGRPISLVLYGESRTGKTLWARSLGPHIYNVGLVSGEECMKASDVKYAVFDDIRGGIKFFPAFKEWLGGQATVCVKRLYRDPRLITWGKPSIWISNDDPRPHMDPADAAWLEANARFIEVSRPIFRANTE